MGAPNTTRAVEAARRALGRRRAVEFAGVGATSGALGAVLIIPIFRFASEPLDAWGLWLIGLAGACGLAGGVAGWLTRVDGAGAARELDRRLALHDLLPTTLELEGSGSPQAALLVERAEQVASSVRPRAVLPLAPAIRTAWWVWLGPTLAIGVGVGLWLPTRAAEGPVPPVPAPAALTREAVDLVREVAKAMEATTPAQAKPGGHPANEWQREIERELAAGGRSEIQTRALAAQAAERAADTIEESARQATERADSLAERLADAAAASRALPAAAPSVGRSGADAREVEGPGQALREAVTEGRLGDAASVIAEARRRHAEMSPQDREALARELEKWASELSSAGEGTAPDERPLAPTASPAPGEPTSTENGRAPEHSGGTGVDPAEKLPVSDAKRRPPGGVDPDPLVEQLRDAARDVRGESPPSGPDPDARQPREASPPRDASPAAGQRPEQTDERRVAPTEPTGGEKGKPRDASDQKEGPGQSANEAPNPRRDDAGESESKQGEGRSAERQPDQPNSGRTQDGQSREGQSRPGENTPVAQPAGEKSPREQRSPSNERDSTESPGQTPGGEAPGRPTGATTREARGSGPDAQPGNGRQPSGGLEGLEQTLRETERIRDKAGQDAARARHLRERARQILNPESGRPDGARDDGQPRAGQGQDGGAGVGSDEESRPGLHEAPDPRRPGDFSSAEEQIDLRPPGDTEGPMTPLAEWDRAPGEASPGPVGSGVAGRLRAAAGSAERAIEDRRVPPQYADLVRRVFRRYVDRPPGGGTP